MAVEEAVKEQPKSKIDTTKTMNCKCPSTFQDKRYGPGKRLHNTGYKGSSIKGYTCTVCGDFKHGN